MNNLTISPLTFEDVKATEKLWHDGWHETHDHLVPPYPPNERSLKRFKERLSESQDRTRIAHYQDQPAGLCMTENDEVAQLFVANHCQGLGLGQMLLFDAENRIKQDSFSQAWLTVVVGNDPARAFYEKCGWAVVNTLDVDLSGVRKGCISLKMWRMEKEIRREAKKT